MSSKHDPLSGFRPPDIPESLREKVLRRSGEEFLRTPERDEPLFTRWDWSWAALLLVLAISCGASFLRGSAGAAGLEQAAQQQTYAFANRLAMRQDPVAFEAERLKALSDWEAHHEN